MTHETSKVYSFSVMKPYFYAGIGSRETPGHILRFFTYVAACLSTIGYTLRTGGAEGADNAFLQTALTEELPYELWLPWKGYGGHTARCRVPNTLGFDSVGRYHPMPKKLTDGVRKLHARNYHIIMGGDGETPVDFVVCWTPDGKDSGGTGQAIRIAEDHGIPVLNVHNTDNLAELLEIMAICMRNGRR